MDGLMNGPTRHGSKVQEARVTLDQHHFRKSLLIFCCLKIQKDANKPQRDTEWPERNERLPKRHLDVTIKIQKEPQTGTTWSQKDNTTVSHLHNNTSLSLLLFYSVFLSFKLDLFCSGVFDLWCNVYLAVVVPEFFPWGINEVLSRQIRQRRGATHSSHSETQDDN